MLTFILICDLFKKVTAIRENGDRVCEWRNVCQCQFAHDGLLTIVDHHVCPVAVVHFTTQPSGVTSRRPTESLDDTLTPSLTH